MGWDVAVFGSLQIAPKHVDAWLDTALDASKFKGFRGYFANDEFPARAAKTVRAELEAWKKMTSKGAHVLEVGIARGKVTISGLVPKEEFVDRARRYALVFRHAEAVKAVGTVTFVGVGNTFAWRLGLNGAKPSTLEALDEDLEDSAAVMKLLAKLGPKLGGASKGARIRKGSKAAEPLPLDAASQKALAAIEARLRKADASEVAKIVGSVGGWVFVNGLPVSASAMKPDQRRALVFSDPAARAPERVQSIALALRTAAALDRAFATPLLLQLAGPAVHPEVRVAALGALNGDRSPEAVEALLVAFSSPGPKRVAGFQHPPATRAVAAQALAATGLPLVAERVLSLLTEKSLAIPVGRTGDYHDSSSKAVDMQAFVVGALTILGKIGHRPAWARVESIFKTHPLTEVRKTAAGALFALATEDEIAKAFGQGKKAFIKSCSSSDEWFNAIAWNKLTRELLAAARRAT